MKYYVTIYIDQLIEREILSLDDFTHAFLGLTKEKTPDELDTMKFERETNKQIWSFELGKMIYLKEEYKWYDTTETNEFNDGFYGFAPVKSSVSHWGKVFENNHLRR